MFTILTTKTFLKEISKVLSKEELREFSKFKDKLKSNPYLGKSLRVNFVREYKLKGKRIYFIIYEEYSTILFVDCGNKKNQCKKIDTIFFSLELFHEYVRSYSL